MSTSEFDPQSFIEESEERANQKSALQLHKEKKAKEKADKAERRNQEQILSKD